MIFIKTAFDLQDRIIGREKEFLFIGRMNFVSGFDDCGNEKGFVDIDATIILINNFNF